MAFPIPAHLPRRTSPQDVSSQILSKIDAATNRSLTSTLATSWLTELDDTIQSTKVLGLSDLFSLSCNNFSL
jgi:centromere/kinetochore protein ZW10